LYTKIDSWNNTNNVVDHNAERKATSTAIVLICKGKINKTKFKKKELTWNEEDRKSSTPFRSNAEITK
jgi:hypothetical protein